MSKRCFKKRTEKGATEIAQFPLTLYCLFLVLLLPILNLVSLLIAGATAYLATNDLAAKAATQPSFAQALNAMALQAYYFQSTDLAKFVKMSPQGGYTGCGSDLFILITNLAGAGVQSSAANQAITQAVDTNKNIYELQVISAYSISPLISLASVPLLGSIPGLGQPLDIKFAASRPVENPGGMQTVTDSHNGNGNGGNGQGAVTPFAKVWNTAPGTYPAAGPGTWRHPGVYAQIAAAGETVVSDSVVVVQASNLNWTPSGVDLGPGEKIYTDTQAAGSWGIGANNTGRPQVTGADGEPSIPGLKPCSGANTAALVAGINQLGLMVPATPNTFLLGETNNDYAAPGTGHLSLGFNYLLPGSQPGINNGFGAQMVRVIVVR